MTLDVLERIALDSSSKHPNTASLLQLLNSITKCLLYGGDYGGHDTDRILHQLHAWQGLGPFRVETFFSRTQAEEHGF